MADAAGTPAEPFDLATQFWGVFIHAPFGQMFVTMDGHITIANDYLAEMLGYQTTEIVGMHVLDLIDPLDHAATIAARDAIRDGHTTSTVGLRRYLTKDGTRIPVRVVNFIAPGPDGRQQGCGVVVINPADFAGGNTAGTQWSDHEIAHEMVFAVAGILNRAIDVEAAAEAMLGEICTRMGWPAGALLHWVDGIAEPEFASSFGDETRLKGLRLPWPDRPEPTLRHSPGGDVLVLPIAGGLSGQLAAVFEIGTEDAAIPYPALAMIGELASHAAERRAATKRLADSEAQFRALFNTSPLAKALILDGGYTLYAVNDAMCELLGRSREELLGTSISDLTHPDDRHLIDESRRLAAKSGQDHRYERRFLHSSGAVLNTETAVTWISGRTGAPLLLLQVEDITDRRRLQQSLVEQADTDQVTGIASRFRLHREIDALETSGDDFAALFLDLDGFGAINDAHGHRVGDAVLRIVATRLADASAGRHLTARVGGDEFAILCRSTPEMVAAREVRALAERIRLALAEPIITSDGPIHVGASIGICDSTIPSRTAMERLQRADAAAHQAKRLGKDRRIIYDVALHAATTETRRIEALLATALDEDRFVLHYQPIVDIADGHLAEVEALVRMTDYDATLISPALFIPVAEHTGMVTAMGTWVLREACRKIAELRRSAAGLTLSVNLSARQAARSDLVDTVTSALDEAGLPPAALTIELTESTLLDADADSLERLTALRAMGIQIALDDFGTGYSSLTYLQQLPLTKLKIDQSFVRRITTDPGSAAIVRAVTRLASDLGLAWVTEGIETREQWQAIQQFGPGYGQGFLFARPIPFAELTYRVTAPGGGSWPAPGQVDAVVTPLRSAGPRAEAG